MDSAPDLFDPFPPLELLPDPDEADPFAVVAFANCAESGTKFAWTTSSAESSDPKVDEFILCCSAPDRQTNPQVPFEAHCAAAASAELWSSGMIVFAVNGAACAVRARSRARIPL